jgi:DNA-binding IclR family transcriptional regulator
MNRSYTSIEKIIDILCSFSREHPRYTAEEISKQFKIPLSSTYKYLDILLKKGFLTKINNTKKYSIGLTIFKLGNLFSTNLGLTEYAIPHMRHLSESSGNTVMLTVVHGWESICIEKIESANRIKFTIDIGATLPLHAGASSKVLLAYQDERFISEYLKSIKLVKFTKNTITNPVYLKRDLETIRDKGFAYSDSEADVAVKAVSAPIFNHMRNILAGLAIVVPRERMSSDNFLDLIELVKTAAKKISLSFGYIDG